MADRLRVRATTRTNKIVIFEIRIINYVYYSSSFYGIVDILEYAGPHCPLMVIIVEMYEK